MGLHKNFKGRTLKKIDRAWRSFLKADLERKKNGVTIACRERDITNSIIKKKNLHEKKKLPAGPLSS